MVVGGTFAHREGPGWLAPFLSIDEFFGHCSIHSNRSGLGKNEKNHFCLHCCYEGPLCPTCVAESHAGHSTIQVRRASHRDVVRIVDISKFLDISSMQTYTINSAKILFLQSKPQPKFTKGALHYCETCHRSTADPVRFCSMLCKLIGIQENPHDFTLSFSLNEELISSSFGGGHILAHRGSGGAVVGTAAAAQDSPSDDGSAADLMPSTPKAKMARKRKLSFTEPGVPTTAAAAYRNHYPLFANSDLAIPEYMFSQILSGPPTPKRMEGSVRTRFHQRKQDHPHRAPLS